MALFRALSTTRGRRGGYDRLLDETTSDSAASYADHQDHAVLKRVTSVPARMLFGSSTKKLGSQPSVPTTDSKAKKQGKKAEKIHPLFSLFEGKGKKKKMTANPDFSRYIEYLKEGGMWNKGKDSPAIYYK
uniref:Uncharacterized protein n=1 Tax=Opuntia streptacantha TaxID=393608 RepID=A0A7C8YPW3_OPUST